METNDNQEVTTETAEDIAENTETPAADDSQHDDGGAFTPDDALMERAIRAGMSLADIRECPSKAFAERMIGAFESKGGKTAGGDTERREEDGDDIPAVDLGNVSVESGYDAGLCGAINSMKSALDAQAKVINRLLKGQSVPKSMVAKAVETRKNLAISRPGGEGGRRGDSPKSTDAEILASMRNKFKLN